MSALVLRELRLAATGGSALLPLVFFLLVATLFPFAIGPDAPLLARTGGGALWMAALLAALLPIDRLVEPDRASGVLDQLAVRGIGEESIALAKLAAHWLSFGPPLMLAGLPAAALMKLPQPVLIRLELGLLAGTPGLAALSLIVAALTSGLRTTGALAGLLMLPLAVPILIFGAGMVEPGADTGAAKLLAAASLLLVAIAPFAAGAAIRAMSPHSTRPPRPPSAWLSSSPIASADIRTA
jgi:heme exporter protein B